MYKTSLILAAGDGKRMKSDLPKVMHKVCGYPLVKHVFNAIKSVSDDEPIVITGRRGELMHELFGDTARFAEQTERRGTAHAVMCGQHYLEGKEGYVIITAGDMPLITAETFADLFDTAIKENMSACVLTAIVDDATGYGRILRDSDNSVIGIVEHRDATDEQKKIKEINTSVYCFRIEDLLASLSRVTDNNAQGEFYLTDTLGILRGMGKKVGGCIVRDVTEAMGINDRVQLSEAQIKMQKRINERIMRDGVTILNPASTYIEAGVLIGRETVIYPGNTFIGNTVIGASCVIMPNSTFVDTAIGNDTTVYPGNTFIGNSVVGEGCIIMPNSTFVDASIKKGAVVQSGSYVK